VVGRGAPRKRPDPTTPIHEIGEFDLIDRLVRKLGPTAPPSPKGPGDDAAVVPTGPRTLVTTDTLEEDVHFRRSWSDPEDVGIKALEVNFSDIAAMGGRPTAAVISLALPPELPVGALDSLYGGIAFAARRAGVSVAGGNVARSATGRIAIHVTVLGRPLGRRPVLRSGARPGDLLVVSGHPGLAALGREWLEETSTGESLWTARVDPSRRPVPPAPVLQRAISRFVRPRARLELGEWAATHGAAAMIDVSDGLAGDVRHLAEASGVGVRLDQEQIQSAAGVRRALDLALYGGEDYELLFAIPAVTWMRVPKPGGIRLTPIGEVTGPRNRITIHGPFGDRLLDSGGFEHFGKPER
jgi:thiamine-monophosphate kinase